MALTRKHWWIITFIVPIGYFLGAYIFFRFVPMDWRAPETMSWSFLFLVPFTVGLLTVLFDRKPRDSYKKMLWRSQWILMLQLGLGCAILIVLAFETLMCVFMAAPFLMVGVWLGCVAGVAIRAPFDPPKQLYSVALLPFLMVAVETQFAASDDVRRVESDIIINASAQEIWDEIVAMQHIRPQEVPWSFAHNVMLVPKPVGASLTSRGVGGVRLVQWQRGVHFKEIVTKWQPGEALEYRWEFAPNSFPRGTLDEYLEIGGRYVDILRGGYRFDTLGPQQTQIVLFTEYRSTTRFNFYTRWWANFLIDDFHQAILTIAKERVEGSA